MKTEYDLLYQINYIGRKLFILKIKDKYAMVYKSSGLAGNNSKDKILPFFYLNEKQTFWKTLGYINKSYKCGIRIETYHSKDYKDFDKNVSDFLEQLTVDFEEYKLPENIEVDNIEDFKTLIKSINKKISEIIGTKKSNHLDWNSL